MSKFEAKTIRDLMTKERSAGRVSRGVGYVVCVECDDGSWCELDATSVPHAKTLADNWVDKMNARGASVRRVLPAGTLARDTLYTKFAELPVGFRSTDN